jgi:hypothetical protein
MSIDGIKQSASLSKLVTPRLSELKLVFEAVYREKICPGSCPRIRLWRGSDIIIEVGSKLLYLRKRLMKIRQGETEAPLRNRVVGAIGHGNSL